MALFSVSTEVVYEGSSVRVVRTVEAKSFAEAAQKVAANFGIEGKEK